MRATQAKTEVVHIRVPALVSYFIQEEVMSQFKIRLAKKLLVAYAVLIGISMLAVGYGALQLLKSSMAMPTYFSAPELILLLIVSMILLAEFLFGFRRDLRRLRSLEQ